MASILLRKKKILVNDSLNGVSFEVDPVSGKITGYKTKIGGADAVFPFSGAEKVMYNVKTNATGDNTASVYIDTYLVSGGKEILLSTIIPDLGSQPKPETAFFELVYGSLTIAHYTITAKKTVELNGVTYQAGQRLPEWRYTDTVDLKIYGDYSALMS